MRPSVTSRPTATRRAARPSSSVDLARSAAVARMRPSATVLLDRAGQRREASSSLPRAGSCRSARYERQAERSARRSARSCGHVLRAGVRRQPHRSRSRRRRTAAVASDRARARPLGWPGDAADDRGSGSRRRCSVLPLLEAPRRGASDAAAVDCGCAVAVRVRVRVESRAATRTRTRPIPAARRGRLARNPGGDLLSQGVSPQVPSALAVFTAVFGMGTGVSPPQLPPETLSNVNRQMAPSSRTPERARAHGAREERSQALGRLVPVG